MTEVAITLPANRAPARTERMCAATRRALPTQAMIRFACSPDGEVMPDIAHRLGGRGVWLTASRLVIEGAAKRGVFAKGFKRDTRARPELAEATERALAEATVAAFAAADRAGLVATEPGQAQAAVSGGRAIALCEATDSAPEAEFASNPVDLPTIKVLTKAQFSLALGRPNVVHAALLAGPASTKFLTRCDGLVRYRTPEGEVAAMGGKQTATKRI